MEYMPKYLVMVTEQNNNKFYKMTPRGDRFDVEYGRVGGGNQSASYSINQWNKKYNEKLSKGYVDRTSLVEDLIVKQRPSTSDGYRTIENKAIEEIVDRLQSMAKKAVANNYTISSANVTMAMVDEAQRVLASLITCLTVDEFNKTLLELYGVIPRKMSQVSSYIAKKIGDFGAIIDREQDLLDVMKGQIYVPSVTANATDDIPVGGETILETNGLVFEEVDANDVAKIKACLGSCSDKYYSAWRVTNNRTQGDFSDYVNNGTVKTKLLWHGSRNENWWSIVNSGLILKPTNAVITGKMFGYGIYFATKARKSLGYTSINGSYWVRGRSSSAFMGLYDVAYGNPYDVHSFDSKYYSMDYNKLQKVCPGTNCIHAHEGAMLRNDEIIVYQECQTTIRYLVELR